jgi:hypothetical protein
MCIELAIVVLRSISSAMEAATSGRKESEENEAISNSRKKDEAISNSW